MIELNENVCTRSTDDVRHGGCLCGKVRFSAKLNDGNVSVCHCHMCQKWSSGMFMGIVVDPKVEITGEDDFSAYVSSSWGERLFCSSCGTSLGWRMHDHSFISMNAAAFDDQNGFKLVQEIYVDEKLPYFEFANQTYKMTGKEVEALYSNKEI